MTKAAALLEKVPAAGARARVSRTRARGAQRARPREVEQRGYGDAFWGHDRAAGAERYERDAMLAEETPAPRGRVGAAAAPVRGTDAPRRVARRVPRAPRRLSLPHTQNPPLPPFPPPARSWEQEHLPRCSATARARAARRTLGPTTSGTLTRACRPTPS